MEKGTRSLSKANNHFALNLHKSFANEEGNIFFSPFSISTALAMLYKGARGSTAKEMRHVLRYDNGKWNRFGKLSDDQVHKSFRNLLTTIGDNPDIYCLTIANALLVQKDFPFLSHYKEDLQKIYRAVAREVDFVHESQKVVTEINEWMKENTKNMIEKLFDSLDSSSIMVFSNAVFFKGSWQTPFDPECTTLKRFYNNGLQDRFKHVPMMCMKKYFEFFRGDSFKALQLPYSGGNIAMLLLLPNQRDGLKKLEQNLTLDLVYGVRQRLSFVNLEVTLPKFHLEYTKELIEVLQKLGMQKIFSVEADLKGLSKYCGLFVSQILHKAVVTVNEEGTEASAVTGIAAVFCSAPLCEPIFTADHPFIFCIADKSSDLILFMGRVEEI